jgi:hypothetical protein
VFTVDKAVRASDVLKSIEMHNSTASEPLSIEKFNENDECAIVTFEKGQRFLQHPFYAVMREVEEEEENAGGSAEGGDSDPTQSSGTKKYCKWTADGATTDSRVKKRVFGELASDLVQDSILPTLTKRSRGGKKSTEVMICHFYSELWCGWVMVSMTDSFFSRRRGKAHRGRWGVSHHPVYPIRSRSPSRVHSAVLLVRPVRRGL